MSRKFPGHKFGRPAETQNPPRPTHGHYRFPLYNTPDALSIIILIDHVNFMFFHNSPAAHYQATVTPHLLRTIITHHSMTTTSAHRLGGRDIFQDGSGDFGRLEMGGNRWIGLNRRGQYRP